MACFMQHFGQGTTFVLVTNTNSRVFQRRKVVTGQVRQLTFFFFGRKILRRFCSRGRRPTSRPILAAMSVSTSALVAALAREEARHKEELEKSVDHYGHGSGDFLSFQEDIVESQNETVFQDVVEFDEEGHDQCQDEELEGDEGQVSESDVITDLFMVIDRISQVFPLHRETCDRFRRTLYYASSLPSDVNLDKLATIGRAESEENSEDEDDVTTPDDSVGDDPAHGFTLPLTEVCVEAFERAAEDVRATLGCSVAEDVDADDDGEVDDSSSSMDEEEMEIRAARMAQRRKRRTRGLDRLDVRRAAGLSGSVSASPTSLVVALLYLERLRAKNPNYLATVSSTDLFLISLLVASKFLNDDGEDDEVFNGDWAEAAGMEKKELNKKELDFLVAVDWSVHVTPPEFSRMSHLVEASAALRELGRRRGQAGCHRRWRDRGGGGRRRGSRPSRSSLSLVEAPSATYSELLTLTEAATSVENKAGVDTAAASQIWRLVTQCTVKVS